MQVTRRLFVRYLSAAVAIGSGVTLVACGTSTAKERTIRMEEMTYQPATLTVPRGTTVVWRNESDFIHTVTTDPSKLIDGSRVSAPNGKIFDSGNIQPRDSWSYTFDEPGDVQYCCIPHELANMRGSITVEP